MQKNFIYFLFIYSNFANWFLYPSTTKCLRFFRMADLCVCLGTSLQIQPINLVPFNAKKNKGKVVICNLQKTNCVSIL